MHLHLQIQLLLKTVTNEYIYIGIGFAVNDQLCQFRYADEKSTREFATSATAEVELGVESIQAAYTMGI